MKSIFFERCNNVRILEHADIQSGDSAVNDHTACLTQQINAVNSGCERYVLWGISAEKLPKMLP